MILMREPSKTTVAVVPAQIRASLDEVLDYVGRAEAEDYRSSAAGRRKGHIYRAIREVRQWLNAMTTADGEREIEVICDLLEAYGHIAALWCVADVAILRPDLTEAQCWEVLDKCQHEHDAGVGINWDVIEDAAEELFPESEGQP